MTSKKQTLIRLGVFLLLAFGLAMIPQIICLAVFGYEKWMESPMAVVVTLSMFAPMLGNILTRLITKEGWDDCKLRLNLTGNLRFYIMGALIPVIWFLISALIDAVSSLTEAFLRTLLAAMLKQPEMITKAAPIINNGIDDPI